MNTRATKTRLFSRIGIGIFATVVLIASLLCLNSFQMSKEAPCGETAQHSSSSLCDSPINHVSLANRAIPQNALGLAAFFLLLATFALHYESVARFFNSLKKFFSPPPRPIRLRAVSYRSIFVYLFAKGILHTQVYSY